MSVSRPIKSQRSLRPALLLRATLAGVLHVLALAAPFTLLCIFQTVVMNTAIIIVLCMCGIWAAVEYAAHTRFSRVATHCIRASALPRAQCLSILIALWMGLIDAAVHGCPAESLIAIGGVLLSAGIALRCSAIVQLGDHFHDDVITLPGQTMVTTGMYRWIRHPSELGNLLITAGASVALGSAVAGLVVAIVVVPVTLLRVHREDDLLRAELDGYEAYARHVGALVPILRMPGEESSFPWR